MSFNDLESERDIQGYAANLPRVILEGPTDVRLFRDWFADLLVQVEFVDAAKVIGSGGCTAVRKAVEKSRELEIPAVGVVDRDSLQHDHRWDLLFSVDDDAFAQGAIDDDLFTTSLWEVEAYLLEPALLAEWVAMQKDPMPASASEQSSALQRTLEECEGLLSAAPFLCASHEAGDLCDLRYFLADKHHEIEDVCRRTLAKGADAKRAVADALQPLLDAVRQAAPTTPADRLVFLLRYVDTKRLLGRLQQRLKLRDGAHWGLQAQMAREGRRPRELEDFLNKTVPRLAA